MDLLRIVLIVLSFMLAGCGTMTGINFQDGTWSSCTYSKPDGTKFTGPLQLGGAPLAFNKPDGTKVECVPIPSAPAKV